MTLAFTLLAPKLLSAPQVAQTSHLSRTMPTPGPHRRAHIAPTATASPIQPLPLPTDPTQPSAPRTRLTLPPTARLLLAIFLHLLSATVLLTLLESWPLLDSFYFSVVTATTVGYGDLTPSQPLSKLFVSVYSILSVALIGTLFQRLVARLADAQQTLARRAARFLLHETSSTQQPAGFLEEMDTRVFQARAALRAAVVVLAAAILSGAILYRGFLQKGLVDLVYFLVVSMTTVGYGDVYPTTSAGKGYAAVWLVVTSLGFANVLSRWADLKVAEKERDVAKKVLSEDISENIFKEIDRNGDEQLSEAEFLGFMLCKLGKVSPDEVRFLIYFAMRAVQAVCETYKRTDYYYCINRYVPCWTGLVSLTWTILGLSRRTRRTSLRRKQCETKPPMDSAYCPNLGPSFRYSTSSGVEILPRTAFRYGYLPNLSNISRCIAANPSPFFITLAASFPISPASSHSATSPLITSPHFSRTCTLS